MNFIILSASILVSIIILSICLIKAAEKISVALNNVANTLNNNEKQIIVNTSTPSMVYTEPKIVEANKYENNISEAMTRMQERAFEKPAKLNSDVRSVSSASDDDISDIASELQRMS